MAGLVPAIHVYRSAKRKTWMPGTSPGMTNSEIRQNLTTASFGSAAANALPLRAAPALIDKRDGRDGAGGRAASSSQPTRQSRSQPLPGRLRPVARSDVGVVV